MSASKVEKQIIRFQKKEIKSLEKELRRKEKALAETAALLVLQKKVQFLLGNRATGGDEIQPDMRKQAKATGSPPLNKLTEPERDLILRIANSPEFANLTPNIIVPMLADQGKYIASESSFYRVLRDAKQLAHRGKAKPPTIKRPEPLQANGPNQLWSWDITYLPTNVKGIFFYLYLIMDVFSRKIGVFPASLP